MTTTSAESRSPEQLQHIVDAVRSRFIVTQEYIREGASLEFFIDPSQQDTKTKFLSLLQELNKTGDLAALKKSDHGLYLVVFRRPVYKQSRSLLPFVLLVATITTVTIDGYYRASAFGVSSSEVALQTAGLYALCLVGIIGIHEMGHKVASWYHRMNSSWPYFIPGIPTLLPTFGAVISARDPPPNRDSLFDLGLSGPIAGLIATIAVSIIAVASSTISHLGSPPPGAVPLDIYTSWLVTLLKPGSSNGALVSGTTFSVLYFAYSLGFLITFVNLLPAWQLDGGHISNAMVSPRVHKYLTYVSVLIMILTNFIGMAILVLIFSSMAPSLRPLDDVSPLSRNRKIVWVLTWVLSAAIYFLDIFNNLYFGGSLL